MTLIKKNTEIKELINKELPGSLFSSFNYDESMDIKKLKKKGYPYSLAYFDLNDETIIAIGDAKFNKSPVEIIEESKSFSFKLDASIHPRQAQTMYGLKNIFYVKKNKLPKKNNKTKSSDKYYENNLIVQENSDGEIFSIVNNNKKHYAIKLKEGARYIDNYKSWREGCTNLNKNEFLEIKNKLQLNKLFPIPGKLIVKDRTKPYFEGQEPKKDSLGKILQYKNKPIYRITKFTTNIDAQDRYLNELRDTFVFNIFKIDNKVFFAPEQTFLTNMDYQNALGIMHKKLLSMRRFLMDAEQKELYDFKNKSIGSVQITVDFFKNKPYHNCTVKTKGFQHHEIEDIITHVWNNR